MLLLILIYTHFSQASSITIFKNSSFVCEASKIDRGTVLTTNFCAKLVGGNVKYLDSEIAVINFDETSDFYDKTRLSSKNSIFYDTSEYFYPSFDKLTYKSRYFFSNFSAELTIPEKPCRKSIQITKSNNFNMILCPELAFNSKIRNGTPLFQAIPQNKKVL